MKIPAAAAAALLIVACGDNPADPGPWPDGANLYISSGNPDTALSWSPGGSVLLFNTYAYSSYCIMGFDGLSDPVAVAASTDDESSGPNGCWSSDQGLIVYTTYNTDSTTTIRTVPGNLGALLVVLSDGKKHLHPTWTADGDSLLFCTLENGYWGLWKAHYQEDSLLVPQEFYTPQWDCLRPSCSPDGQWILYQVKSGSNSEIWLMKSDGTDPQAVVQDAHDNIHPCWGPGSDHFAFSSNRSGDYEIWISDLDGSTLTQVTDDSNDDIYPAWNPGYGWFAFASNRIDGGDYDIFTIDAPSSY